MTLPYGLKAKQFHQAIQSVSDFPGPSEVELVPVVQNEPVDYDGEKPVVIVVRPSSFDIPGGIGGFGGFPGFGDLPRLPASFGDFGDVGKAPTISLSDIFGPANEQPLLPVNNGCGLICKVFKTLEGQLGVMQGEIDGLKTELHNKEIIEGTYDNHTTTYDEKVIRIQRWIFFRQCAASFCK